MGGRKFNFRAAPGQHRPSRHSSQCKSKTTGLPAPVGTLAEISGVPTLVTGER